MVKIETLKAEMHELIVAFEPESNRLENALMGWIEKSLDMDMRSIGGDGHTLSKEINCKIDALLKLTSTPPVVPATPQLPPVDVETLVNDICAGMDYDVDKEEDVLINFKEKVAEIKKQVWDATILAKT